MNDFSPPGAGSLLKASDLFVRCLEAEGVEYIFGLPGEENADLVMSLTDSDITFVLCRHEQAAAFMAETYGRLTGKPGVCLATLGPGATNLVTGLADANMDHAPVVAIIGQASTARLHKESHQNMDAIGMFAPLSKWAHSIYRADSIPEIVRKAFKLAALEKPGATVVELPEDVASAMTSARPLPIHKQRRPAADHRSIKDALGLLASSRHPLVLAGNGVSRTRAAGQLRRLVKKLGIPVVNTFMGKGVLDCDDPHCFFTIGLQGRDHVNSLFDQADLVITVGYDLAEYAPSLWNKGRDKKVICIDHQSPDVDENFPIALEIVADISDSLWHLNEAVNNLPRLPLFDIEKLQALRKTIHDDLWSEVEDLSFPIKPQRIINVLRKQLSAEDILLSDVGAHKMWIARTYQCHQINTCLISNGFCSMGFALPGAIGAKIACPKSRVVAVCGDGGFLMNIQDIETAARLKLALVIVVFVDNAYGLIKWKQENHFDGRSSPLAFTNPDFPLLAKAFGLWGRRVTSAEELEPALEEALNQEGPAILAVPVDYDENRKLTERLGQLVCAI